MGIITQFPDLQILKVGDITVVMNDEDRYTFKFALEPGKLHMIHKLRATAIDIPAAMEIRLLEVRVDGVPINIVVGTLNSAKQYAFFSEALEWIATSIAEDAQAFSEMTSFPIRKQLEVDVYANVLVAPQSVNVQLWALVHDDPNRIYGQGARVGGTAQDAVGGAEQTELKERNPSQKREYHASEVVIR
jgi:hypothetical protein